MKNYSRTKGKSKRVAFRTPSRVRVQQTLIAKIKGSAMFGRSGIVGKTAL